jgi:hypothetical protein
VNVVVKVPTSEVSVITKGLRTKEGHVTGVREIILKRNLSNFLGAEINVGAKKLWGSSPPQVFICEGDRPRGAGACGLSTNEEQAHNEWQTAVPYLHRTTVVGLRNYIKNCRTS